MPPKKAGIPKSKQFEGIKEMPTPRTTKRPIWADPKVRRAYGFDDGMMARKANRLPTWGNRSHLYRPAHPFDAKYGEGFWAGWDAYVPVSEG